MELNKLINDFIIKKLEKKASGKSLSLEIRLWLAFLALSLPFYILKHFELSHYFVLFTFAQLTLSLLAFPILLIPFLNKKRNEPLLLILCCFFPTLPLISLIMVRALHLFLPGFTERQCEIDSFINNQSRPSHHTWNQVSSLDPLTLVEQPPIPQNAGGAGGFGFIEFVEFGEFMTHLPPKTMRELILEHSGSDLDLFLKKNFNFTNHFKRFFLERIYRDDEIDTNKLLLLMLLPRKKELSHDVLREIMLTITFIDLYKELSETEINTLMNIGDDKLNFFFNKLSQDQIRLIFTRPFDLDEYIELLLDLNELSAELDPANNMSDLIKNAPSTLKKTEARLVHKFLKDLKSDEFEINILLTPKSFERASKLFSNCVAIYFNRFHSDIFIVTKDRTPIACVEISNNKIVQIAGKQNQPLAPQINDHIYDIFEKAKRNYKES